MHPCVKWMVTASDTAEVRTNACIIVLSEYGGAVTASVALATAWRLTQCMDAPLHGLLAVTHAADQIGQAARVLCYLCKSASCEP